jgi:hypothetical protein
MNRHVQNRRRLHCNYLAFKTAIDLKMAALAHLLAAHRHQYEMAVQATVAEERVAIATQRANEAFEDEGAVFEAGFEPQRATFAPVRAYNEQEEQEAYELDEPEVYELEEPDVHVLEEPEVYELEALDEYQPLREAYEQEERAEYEPEESTYYEPELDEYEPERDEFEVDSDVEYLDVDYVEQKDED